MQHVYFSIRVLLLITVTWLSSACTGSEIGAGVKPTDQPSSPSQTVASPSPLPATSTQIPLVVESTLPSPQVSTPLSTDATTQDLSNYALVGVDPGGELAVHQAASADSLIAGILPFEATGIRITGKGVEADGLVWVPIHWENLDGWVEQAHLARQVGTLEPAAIQFARQVAWSIKQRDFALLSTVVHPQKGVRFSPYSYVHMTERDLVFSANQVAGFSSDATTYLWGSYDGSGAPINLTPQDYFNEFVYDVDFAQPEQLGLNQVLGKGNTINNITEAYPQAVFLEFYFSGFDVQYGGMDWRSLRLVFEKIEDVWYLVGIVHDEWTT